MNGFDSWEATLYHSGVLGMKHGRRRYQNEDGTWTPLGLRERRKREGFGERAEARAQKKEAKAQHKAAVAAAKAEKHAQRRENLRKMSVKGLTDAEIKAKISRLKLEQEYKELKRGPTLKTAENIVNRIFDSLDKKYEREKESRDYNLKLLQTKNELQKSKNDLKVSENKMLAEKARTKAEVAKQQTELANIKSGTAKIKAKTAYREAKTSYKQTTMFGAVRKFFNNRAAVKKPTEAEKQKYREWQERVLDKNGTTSIERAKAEVEARRIRDQYNYGTNKKKSRHRGDEKL